MSSAKVSSLPPTRSASAMVASFPDCTIMPWISTSTGTCVPTCTKVREPSAFHACSLIVTFSLSPSLPSLSAWNTTYAVISLVMLGIEPLVGIVLDQRAPAVVIDEDVAARLEDRWRGHGHVCEQETGNEQQRCESEERPFHRAVVTRSRESAQCSRFDGLVESRNQSTARRAS